MFGCSKYSKKKYYHTQNCIYFKKTKKKNKIWYPNKESAVNDGYHACPWCSYVGILYNKEKNEIREYARTHNLKVWYENDMVLVKSDLAYWKIVTEGNKHKPHLYHENNQIYRWNTITDGKYDIAYHAQEHVFRPTILEYLMYIEKHEKWRDGYECSYRNISRKTKKGRVKYKIERNKARGKSIRRVLNRIEELELKDASNMN